MFFTLPKHASEEAKNKIINPKPTINTQYSESEIICEPSNSTPSIGIIFYTGAQIEACSYAGIFEQLAENNILVMAKDNPIHYAFFSKGDCTSDFARYPNIKKWYFAGHSLGGEIADQQSLEYQDQVVGAINLAAQPRNDFSNTNLHLLNIYASNDTIAVPSDYEKFQNNLPPIHECHIIEGGIHAYFGSHPKRFFDGEPQITREEQAQQTVKFILNFVNS